MNRNWTFDIDIKLGENFCRKSIYCANGHNPGPEYLLTYIITVDQYYMIIMLLAAALDYFSILGEDLHIEFFIAPNQKKYYLILGP